MLPFDHHTAEYFDQSRAEPYRNERSISPCDMVIAGYARANGLIPVSNTLKVFEGVAGLIFARVCGDWRSFAEIIFPNYLILAAND